MGVWERCGRWCFSFFFLFLFSFDGLGDSVFEDQEVMALRPDRKNGGSGRDGRWSHVDDGGRRTCGGVGVDRWVRVLYLGASGGGGGLVGGY